MTYTVQAGDTLEAISLRFLGTRSAAATLFRINQSRIKSGSPSRLTPGEQLTIPEQMLQAAKGKGLHRDPGEVSIEIDGLSYAGWESVTITRSLEHACGAFQVSLSDRWLPESEPWPIFEGDECRIFIGTDLVLTGYVNTVEASIDAGQRSLSVAGRDRTSDLIDCSAMNRPGQFRRKKLETLAQLLAAPFGISVRANVETGAALDKFDLQPAEKVHEAIERAARAKNLIVITTRASEYLITRSGSQRASDAIIEGKNLLRGESKASDADRYSLYVVEGQGAGQGKDKHSFRGEYKDSSVGRYRPLIIHADSKADGVSVKGRAEWEARARAAKARSGGATVVGWRQSNGQLWEINRLVSVDCPTLSLFGDHLISQVEFSRSDQGTLTQLTLVRPDAYTSEEGLKAQKDIIKVRKLEQKGKRGGKGKAGVDMAAVKRELETLK